MSFGFGSAGSGLYEQWTSRLQRWSRDPATPLDDLPGLDDDSFTKDTYLLLFRHVQDAISVFMDRWRAELELSFGRVSTAYELGTEMVRLRHLLRPRVDLARLCAWPEPLRAALLDGLKADVEGLQRELEQVLATSQSRGWFDRDRADALVAVIRRNPLTGVLAGPPPPPVVDYTLPSGPAPDRVPRTPTARRILF